MFRDERWPFLALLFVACGLEPSAANVPGGTPAVRAADQGIAVAASGSADPCADGGLAVAYGNGLAAGGRVVTRHWRKFGKNCADVEGFADSLMTELRVLNVDTETLRPRKRCRYAGAIQGVFDELEQIQNTCADRCFMHGGRVGRIMAKQYCDLMIDGDGDLDPGPWLRRPVGICGLEFEMSCDSKFIAVTSAYESDAGVCLPYTTSTYQAVWDNSRSMLCEFQPPPAPVPQVP